MNTKNVFGIAALIIAAAFAVQMFQQTQAEARQPTTRLQTQSTSPAVEFARLEIVEEDAVTWLIGGNDPVRTESVRETYRRLGGTGRGSFSDLLNQIGSDGWNLIDREGNFWIFSRRAS